MRVIIRTNDQTASTRGGRGEHDTGQGATGGHQKEIEKETEGLIYLNQDQTGGEPKDSGLRGDHGATALVKSGNL